jgi:hypothetical protein
VSRRRYEDHPTAAEVAGAAVLLIATLFLAWITSVLTTPL